MLACTSPDAVAPGAPPPNDAGPVVDVASGFFPLRVGDTVQFARIDEKRYRELEGERLA